LGSVLPFKVDIVWSTQLRELQSTNPQKSKWAGHLSTLEVCHDKALYKSTFTLRYQEQIVQSAITQPRIVVFCWNLVYECNTGPRKG